MWKIDIHGEGTFAFGGKGKWVFIRNLGIVTRTYTNREDNSRRKADVVRR